MGPWGCPEFSLSIWQLPLSFLSEAFPVPHCFLQTPVITSHLLSRDDFALELKKNRSQQAGISSTSCLPPMNEAAPTPTLSCIELYCSGRADPLLPQDCSLSLWASWDPVPWVLSCPTSLFSFLSSSPQPSSGGPLHFQAHLHHFGW